MEVVRIRASERLKDVIYEGCGGGEDGSSL